MNSRKNALIYVVEDNKIYNRLVCEYLKKQNYTNVKTFLSGKECIEQVSNGEHPDIVIQDYHLDDSNGIEVLKSVKKFSKESEFIFLTANESMEVAVNTIKFGAFDYVIKDKVALDKVIYKIQKITKLKKLEKKNKQIRMFMILFMAIIFVIVLFSFLFFVVDIFGVN